MHTASLVRRDGQFSALVTTSSPRLKTRAWCGDLCWDEPISPSQRCCMHIISLSGVYHGKEGCVFVNQDRQWREHMPPIWAVYHFMLRSPAMTVTLTDTRSHVVVTHPVTHHSQCEVGVRQHNQCHWQAGQGSYPGGANPVECLNNNLKGWKLEFRARQVKQSEAWSEGCAILFWLELLWLTCQSTAKYEAFLT